MSRPQAIQFPAALTSTAVFVSLPSAYISASPHNFLGILLEVVQVFFRGGRDCFFVQHSQSRGGWWRCRGESRASKVVRFPFSIVSIFRCRRRGGDETPQVLELTWSSIEFRAKGILISLACTCKSLRTDHALFANDTHKLAI